MKGTTHLLAGFILSAYVLETYAYSSPVLAVILILIGSLIPDIDERSSLLGRRIPIIGYFFKHRSFFHSIVFGIVCVILLAIFVQPMYAWTFFAAFMLHLLLDAITPMGVKPFWPSPLKISGLVPVGGILEKVIFIVALATFIYVLI